MTTAYDVARTWAAQSNVGPERCAAGVWRSGAALYSHNAPIARVVKRVDGAPVALIAADDEHTAAVTRAARSTALPFFLVPHVDDDSHAANLEHIEAQAERCEANPQGPGSTNWSGLAREWRAVAMRYREAFGLAPEFS